MKVSIQSDQIKINIARFSKPILSQDIPECIYKLNLATLTQGSFVVLAAEFRRPIEVSMRDN